MNEPHRVEDYFAGVLDEREREEFERHLTTCADCREALQEIRALDTRLSTELPASIPATEVRPEWVKQVKLQVRTSRQRRRWALAAIPALAALGVALLLVLQPWSTPLSPQQRLEQVYAASLQEGFQGQLTIYEGDSATVAGTFAHSADGKWQVSAIDLIGQQPEAAQNGDLTWSKTLGLSLRGFEGLATVNWMPQLLGAVPTLTSVEATSQNTYIGEDVHYLERLHEGGAQLLSGAGGADNPPPHAEVQVVQGKIGFMRLTFERSGQAPVVVELRIEEYGVPVEIEVPNQ